MLMKQKGRRGLRHHCHPLVEALSIGLNQQLQDPKSKADFVKRKSYVNHHGMYAINHPVNSEVITLNGMPTTSFAASDLYRSSGV